MIAKEHRILAIFSVIAIIALAVSGFMLYKANNTLVTAGPLGEIEADEADPAVWGIYYPHQYDSYLSNYENTEQPSHFETKPYMQIMYAGTGYAAEFNEPRGHLYTLDDIRAIDPNRYKTGAACNTCKSSEVPSLIERYGEDYYLMSFEEINSQITHPIACLDCHDPKTMDLRISRPALIEAFERQGKDITEASRQELRSLVCAQCHVTYYFQPETKKVTFPWDKGIKADEILSYFDDLGFDEWIHPDAGSPLVKPRHAEYEIFMGSTHQSAGLACADCHMPYVKVGNVKISSHQWTSPLNHIEQSCNTCHRQEADWLVDRVNDIQNKTKELQDIAGDVIVQAINELKIARETPGVDQGLLQQAQEMHRKGQWYLDYVIVTNGYGFHNPAESMNNIGKSIDYGHRSIQLAREAVEKAN
ncbi:ammonia-forming cytochrome c nitrite reductase subunit c552 [Desulfofalx alkaliphila]|uniref:ammonia-forming cytochrome c nitrite reductase subunit c552 n=1 Tax=Desulfofalx alkaliphila TaxID=105483 RepID=UPI000AA7C16A|nr:ammonia-forming cytochrome c nitrite reductase subunit c552 [Desulfofalx alkaliphila]